MQFLSVRIHLGADERLGMISKQTNKLVMSMKMQITYITDKLNYHRQVDKNRKSFHQKMRVLVATIGFTIECFHDLRLLAGFC